jgi:hypothetical protein
MATEKPTATRNLDGYGAPVIPWDKVRSRLDSGWTQAPETGGPNRHTSWLATTNPDGSPHVMPLGALWIDGFVYFTSSPDAVKARNLVKNPACSVSVSTADFDLIIEGEASRVTNAPELERLAAEYRDGGWPAQVESGAVTAPFSAPSAGPPPWYVYKLVPDTIYALGASEPYGATRFRF